MKYRSKPVEIEAFRFYMDPMPDWFMDAVSANDVILYNCDFNRFDMSEAHCEIKTPEGTMAAVGGYYIIKGTEGEIYPCKPSVFEAKYEGVTE